MKYDMMIMVCLGIASFDSDLGAPVVPSDDMRRFYETNVVSFPSLSLTHTYFNDL